MLSPVPDADRHAPRAVLEADLQQLVLRPAPAPAPAPASLTDNTIPGSGGGILPGSSAQ